MSGRFLGPVQWRPLGEDRELMGAMQPLARSALGWLFGQIGNQSGVRQGIWNVDFGNGNAGSFHALAIRDPDGHCRSFVSMYSHSATEDTEATYLPTATMYMEHGLLTLDLYDLIFNTNEVIPRIWLPDDIVSYYAGGGTLIPESDPQRNRHFVGKLTQDETLSPSSDFPNPPPTVVDGAHDSIYGVGSWIRFAQLDGYGIYRRVGWKPEQYSGLAQAWVQDWAGAGLTAENVAELLPEGWTTTPGTLGLVRDPAPGGYYWALHANAGALIGVKMRPAIDPSIEVLQWVDAGFLTEADAALAIAYPLASLRQAGLPVTLISAGEMSAAYDGSGQTSSDVSTMLIDDDLPSDATASGWTWATDYAHSGSQSLKQLPNTGSKLSSYTATSALGGVSLSDGTGLSVWVMIESNGNPYELLFGIWDGEAWYSVYWGSDHPSFRTGRYANRVNLGVIPSERNEWVELVIPSEVSEFSDRQIMGVQVLSVGGPSTCKVWWDSFAFVQWGHSWGSGPAAPIQSGWVFDEVGANLDLVAHRDYNPDKSNYAFDAIWSSISITWADGEPTATITVRPPARWRPWWSRSRKLWVIPADNVSDPWLVRNRFFWFGSAGCAASAPVAVFWSEGERSILWYDKDVITPITPGTYYEGDGTSLTTCSLSSPTQIVYGGTLKRVQGGYRLENVFDAENSVGGTGTMTTARWEMSPKGYPETHSPSGTFNYDYPHRNPGATAPCGSVLPTAAEMAPLAAAAKPEGGNSTYGIEWNRCSEEIWKTSRTMTGITSGQLFVLDLRCHGALWGYWGSEGTAETWWNKHLRLKEDGSINLPIHTQRAVILIRQPGSTVWDLHSVVDEAIVQKLIALDINCDVVSYESGDAGTKPVEERWMINGQQVYHRKGAANVIGPPWANWHRGGRYDEPPQKNVWAIRSAGGALIGQEHPGGPATSHGWTGDTSEIGNSIATLFVGAV